ncbi:TIGR01906 family membrane protein [Marinilactibacillus sp. GCM10026970]|uniref:TIGR01906 family membrane protein n=1 Tax=Marinilactibacillus sp. GCM10026970 TaxID=3252642 RepID=UPI003609D1A7
MSRLKESIGIVSLILLIVSTAIAITIWFIPLYQLAIYNYDLPERLGISYDQLMNNYYILLRYLHFPWITELNFPDFISSEDGLFHFYEVKRLFYINYGVLFISGIGTYFYVRFLRKTKRYWVLIKPFFIASLVPPVLLMFLAVAFDQMFVLFHQLFFDNDAWLFNPATDPIINALPESFFMYCFILFFVLIEGSFIIGYQISKRKAFKD